ncbi:MAG: PPOX class F420-dependent oxidoreductase [Anaerolineales bacterium]|jgi:PPOX class probable F420-dependent enzyme
MEKMTSEEMHRFLMATPHTAVLSTVRPDGRPHSTPIWFSMDEDEPVFTTWHTTVKARNLKHNPNVSFCVQDEKPPFAYVLIEGRVSIEEASPQLGAWAAKIGGRYMGSDRAEEFGARNGVPGEWLVHIKPDKVTAVRGIADD